MKPSVLTAILVAKTFSLEFDEVWGFESICTEDELHDLTLIALARQNNGITRLGPSIGTRRGPRALIITSELDTWAATPFVKRETEYQNGVGLVTTINLSRHAIILLNEIVDGFDDEVLDIAINVNEEFEGAKNSEKRVCLIRELCTSDSVVA